MDRKNVLEIEYKQINEEYYAWWITHQDESVFLRDNFSDEELEVYSYSLPEFALSFTDKQTLYLRGFYDKYDKIPTVITSDLLQPLIDKVAQVNEKYGIRKKTPEEIFAQYTPVPFVAREENYCLFRDTDNNRFIWSSHNSEYDLSIGGIRYYTKEDATAIMEELNENCR